MKMMIEDGVASVDSLKTTALRTLWRTAQVSSSSLDLDRSKRSPLGLGSSELGQHPCPSENRRACRKGPVQHEIVEDV
ncbi:hypothetical protein TNCV_3810771 [Trichonephila clavipes]|nr:hypothetical protein TNCV_3810771 [Trichonephila clavipes]